MPNFANRQAGPKTIFRRSCVAFGSLALTFMEVYVRLRSLKSFLCEKFSRSTESGNGEAFFKTTVSTSCGIGVEVI